MRVLHYAEAASHIERSGIWTSVEHQRTALRNNTDVEVITELAAGGLTPSRVAQGYVPPMIDAIHLNVVGPKSLALARQYHDTDLPVILHAHTTAEDFEESFRFSSTLQPLVRRYLNHFYSYADAVVCPSEYTRGLLSEYNIESPIHVVTNGVDIDSLTGFEQLRDEYRNRYDLDNTVVFTLGNVFERKGLTTFVETAKQLPNYEFVWFGPYDTGPQASEAVRKHTTNPPDNVTFTGWIEDKRGAFAAGDIYYFPTKEENQGIATLEAMACQKPAVLSDIPVFKALYSDGDDCLRRESVDEYVEAIRRIDNDPALAEALGAEARSTAEEHELPRVADGLLDVYQSVR